jgi:hypothetical protein
MGKRRTSTAATTVGASKKTKRATTTVDSDASAIGKWSHSMFMDKDLRKAATDGILKDDAMDNHLVGLEAIPNPPAGLWVMFLAFVL